MNKVENERRIGKKGERRYNKRKKKIKVSASLYISLNALCKGNIELHHKGKREVGKKTQNHRRKFFEKMLIDLWLCGLKIKDINNLKEKHIKALFRLYESQGRKASTLQTYSTHLKRLCGWMGKSNLLDEPRRYFIDPGCFTRTSNATRDKGITDQSIPWSVMYARIEKEDPKVAAQCDMMAEFGLRFEEAMKWRSRIDDRTYLIDVLAGTKGGYERVIPVTYQSQREAINRMKTLVNTKLGSLIPDDERYERYERYVRRIFIRVGFTEMGCGYTAHGLRHEFFNKIYESLIGHKSPIKGGVIVSKEDDRNARLYIARLAGHRRIQITNCYLGSSSTRKAKVTGEKCITINDKTDLRPEWPQVETCLVHGDPGSGHACEEV